MSKCFIYGLVDSRDLMIRYIGQSSVGMRRPKQHNAKWQQHRKCHLYSWIRNLNDAGFQHEIIILESCESRDQLDDLERWWIAYGRASGWKLTNHTSGGEGRKNFDEAARKRLSESMKKAYSTPGARARVSAQMKARWADNREKVIAGLKAGWAKSEAGREKMSRLAETFWKNPENRKALSELRKQQCQNARIEFCFLQYSSVYKELEVL